MAHVFCHHIAAHRGGGAEHDEDGDKFFLPEAHPDGEGKKEDAEAHKLDEGCGDGGFRLPHRLVQPEGGAQGDEPERGGQIAQAGKPFFPEWEEREGGGRTREGPAAMPSMMGLVMIPFSVLFQSPFLGASLAGEVRERTTTAMMLYRGTLPMIISGTSPASP